MSPTAEQMRVAIAEVCGLKLIEAEDGWWDIEDHGKLNKIGCNWEAALDTLPNYPASLDAMHAAEETLNKDQRRQWEFVIADMFQEPGQSWFDVCHMDAHQRAEAFLRVTRPEMFK